MADVITRFKLETTQYDSALRDAANGLADFTRKAALAGNEFAKFTQGSVEVARSFGGITTSANNAKDKVKELVSAFNGVARQYNALTQEQQQSDFGKALAASMEQLKGRISDAKQELYSMGDSGKSTSGIMGMLKEKLTLNIDAFKLFNVGLQAAKAALDVAKDAFFASEQNVDEWGRIMASSQSLYEGFVTSLNNSDFTGFMSRIDDIVKAAREAYNELDRLGTMKTIQAPQIEKQNAENTRMRTMLMTGRYIAPAAGSGLKATMAEGTMLTPEQMRRIEQQLQGGMQTIVKLTGNELEQTGKAIDAYYNKLAKQNGMTMEEFRRGTSSMAEFDKRVEGAKKYDEWQYSHSFVDQQTGKLIAPRTGNPYAQYAGWNNFRVDKQGQNSYNDLVGLIRQQQQQTSQMYSTIGQAYRTINRAEGTTVRNIMGGGSGGGGGKGGGKTGTEIDYAPDSIKAQQAEVQRLTKLWQGAGAAVRDDYKKQLEEAQYTLDRMTGKEKFDPSKMGQITNLPTMSIAPKMEIPEIKMGVITPLKALEDQLESLKKAQEEFGGVSSEVWQNYQQKIDEVTGAIDAFKGKGISNDAKVVKASFKDAASAVGNLGSALSGLDDPGAKIAGTVAQAIANIALAFSSADLKDGETGNVWYWIAATAAGLATMVSTISSIHAATNYAEGGIIKGNSYSGDNIGGLVDGSQFVGLNAGEVVLNAAQQSTLANNLQSSDGGGYKPSHISGEQIWIAMNRYTKRTGRGELVTWK